MHVIDFKRKYSALPEVRPICLNKNIKGKKIPTIISFQMKKSNTSREFHFPIFNNSYELYDVVLKCTIAWKKYIYILLFFNNVDVNVF